ncbi:hypothetical protein B296_00019932 [Ensete ventricosum]|uniref:Uncharacterized protein n=1 Tax=Ensete ventricosum TaxID=4639 RepID=A0A426ZBE8_ENSVE|nr:hypothetical protein B296_00019932 [Ensete ventricosum]
MDAKSLSALEVMKSCHDFDSIVTEGSLAVVRVCYSISEDYALHASLPRQRPYSPSLLGFSVSVDTLKAGLLFPLHPIIEECLKWRRISPSQVVSNLWHYLIAFLGECQRACIISSRDLFMACFHLCKSQSDYYLIARIGFRVSGTPSNNKGWKTRYLFVSGPKWGFRLEWSAHSINNVSPYLFEESILVGRLKRNLSSSQTIRDMTELWLVKVGLSSFPRSMHFVPLFCCSSYRISKTIVRKDDDGAGPEAIAMTEQRATKLLIMNEKLKADLDEASLWLDASNKELNDTLSLLTDAQR